jgi:hypothetical protein
MPIQTDHSETRDDRMPVAISEAAGRPGSPGKRMSTEGWWVEAGAVVGAPRQAPARTTTSSPKDTPGRRRMRRTISGSGA